MYIILNVKVNSFGKAAFSYSAAQPSFDIYLPLVIGLHQETSVRVSLDKQFHSRFCVLPTYGAQVYQTCTDTALSGYQFTSWLNEASEIHFLYPEKFTLGQCRILTTHLSICSRTCYHWSKAPRQKKLQKASSQNLSYVFFKVL